MTQDVWAEQQGHFIFLKGGDARVVQKFFLETKTSYEMETTGGDAITVRFKPGAVLESAVQAIFNALIRWLKSIGYSVHKPEIIYFADMFCPIPM